MIHSFDVRLGEVRDILSTNPLRYLRTVISDLLIDRYGPRLGLLRRDIKKSYTVPDEKFGELSTHIAFVLSKSLNKGVLEVAKELSSFLSKNLDKNYAQVEQVGPYLNIRLTDKFYLDFIKEYCMKELSLIHI